MLIWIRLSKDKYVYNEGAPNRGPWQIPLWVYNLVAPRYEFPPSDEFQMLGSPEALYAQSTY